MTPSRSEILETLGVGCLLLVAGSIWQWGAVALIVSGALIVLVGILLGFVAQPKKKG